jgi:hypothetical protein
MLLVNLAYIMVCYQRLAGRLRLIYNCWGTQHLSQGVSRGINTGPIVQESLCKPTYNKCVSWALFTLNMSSGVFHNKPASMCHAESNAHMAGARDHTGTIP